MNPMVRTPGPVVGGRVVVEADVHLLPDTVVADDAVVRRRTGSRSGYDVAA